MITLLTLSFLGGIALNLMPCVLPSVALKVLSFTRQAYRPWVEGLLYAAGVLTSFWILAACAIIGQLAWGFQLQYSAIIVGLITLFHFFALHMWGLFPMDWMAHVGGRAGDYMSGAKSYLNGILTTVVASPCTGPMLGPILGLTLTMPPLNAFMIFTAMGLGVAAPYVALTLWPRGLAYMPRPGPWMIYMQRAAGVMMWCAAGWLSWILELHWGWCGVKGLWACLIILSVVYYKYRGKYGIH